MSANSFAAALLWKCHLLLIPFAVLDISSESLFCVCLCKLLYANDIAYSRVCAKIIWSKNLK